MYFTSGACGLWSFGNLARKWPSIMVHWEEVEAKMPKYRTQKEKRQLAFRIKSYAIGFCVCAITEHLLTAMSTIYYVKACEPDYEPVAGFFERHIIQLFSLTKYELWKGLFGITVNVMAAFVWNYMNIFVMMISIGLSSRLKQLNDELQSVKGKVLHTKHITMYILNRKGRHSIFNLIKQLLSEDYWEHRRSQFRSIVELCEIVDEEVSPITIIALANNLFFVCVQLMKSLR